MSGSWIGKAGPISLIAAEFGLPLPHEEGPSRRGSALRIAKTLGALDGTFNCRVSQED